jgi:hypothetical protein
MTSRRAVAEMQVAARAPLGIDVTEDPLDLLLGQA